MSEDNRTSFQDLDQVLFNAQLRRSSDLGLWLRQYFERRREARSKEENCMSPPEPSTASPDDLVN
ncbi:hypothetical protein [Bradyrhizobium genosp. P]|uniref:hypothetical protein n=1 Tax=Bradyrhizobium genosp. P TaxID=83641 RepID=UPI003CE886AD